MLAHERTAAYCGYKSSGRSYLVRRIQADPIRPADHDLFGGNVGVSDILKALDREIAQLQQARALLGGHTAPASKKKAGRPKKVVAAVAPASVGPVKKKRNLTPEARKRISEAVKRRWAERKKAGGTK
jgi:hypothetical protein